jgi:hypothetical protein
MVFLRSKIFENELKAELDDELTAELDDELTAELDDELTAELDDELTAELDDEVVGGGYSRTGGWAGFRKEKWCEGVLEQVRVLKDPSWRALVILVFFLFFLAF